MATGMNPHPQIYAEATPHAHTSDPPHEVPINIIRALANSEVPVHELTHQVSLIAWHQVPHTPFVGPNAPWLAPMQAMPGAFTVVPYYRHYRVTNYSQYSTPEELQNMYRTKVQIDGLNTSLASFDGSQTTKLLEFLTSFKEAFYEIGKSETVAVRASAFFLSEDVRECYISRVSPGVTPGNTLAST